MIEPKEIIRSNRKTIALVVTGAGDFIVRAPYFVGNADIMAFIERKQDWLKKKCSAVKVFDEKYSPIVIKNGEIISFLGNDYIINISNVDQITIKEENIIIPNSNNSKELLVDCLKNEALSILCERTERYSEIMGVTAGKLRISGAKTLWGSCSHVNNLNFSWRLIMCPIPVIDYVVVHELSHINYKNHSKDFWARVKSVIPEYKEQQKWLKNNRKLMEII